MRGKKPPTLPLILSGSQSARSAPGNRSEATYGHIHGPGAHTARAHPRPPPSPIGNQGKATRPGLDKGGLDRLEQRWLARKAPSGRASRPGSGASTRSSQPLTGGLACPTCGQKSSHSKEVGSGTQSAAQTPDSGGLAAEDEMALLHAMMAANDVEAAEKKLAEIIEAAEEDGPSQILTSAGPVHPLLNSGTVQPNASADL